MSDGSYEVLFYRSRRGECFAEEFLDGLQAKVNALRELQSKAQEELDALLPSVLDKAFKGEL